MLAAKARARSQPAASLLLQQISSKKFGPLCIRVRLLDIPSPARVHRPMPYKEKFATRSWRFFRRGIDARVGRLVRSSTPDDA
jgi:hypothetical protein